MNDIETFEQSRTRVIEAISQNMDLYGVTPSVGRLYCLLFFSDKPLSLDEMTDELGMSKGSMSLSVRNLLDLNMAERAWVKGERKKLFEANDDHFQRFFDYFLNKWRPAINMNTKAIEQTIAELQDHLADTQASKESRELAQVDIEKLRTWLDYYDWMNRLINTFESEEIFNFIPKDKKMDED